MRNQNAPAKKGVQGVYRVIVADDEPEFLAWLGSLLNSSDDFKVVGEASSGTEAIELITLLVPDLLIADIYMPDPDGLKLARHIHYHFPDTKAILISAHCELVYEKLAREEGALAFIPKVRFSLDTLRQVLQEVR